jgi:DNA-binding IclR family transcriptional regulator
MAKSGSQTLLRGLDLIEAIADGEHDLTRAAEQVGLTRSTAYRLASALVERRYLDLVTRVGYRLGPKLLELGSETQRQTDLVQSARPFLERLSAETLDTVHLGILDDGKALYLDKIAGRRRIEISSRIGERQPLTSTGLGKALILDMPDSQWAELHSSEKNPSDLVEWIGRMRAYADEGHAYDLEENEDRIRCVAAPIRNASGKIAAAMSLSSARQYMDDERMAKLTGQVRACAVAISGELGWRERPASRAPVARP